MDDKMRGDEFPKEAQSKKPVQHTVLLVVPEKRLLNREVLSSFSSQFWSQTSQSSQCIDGSISSAPGEPSPLPLLAPSGLSRVQFVVAAQALRLPCCPVYCQDQGGVVLDRVLLKAGGESWWSALSGRFKAQRFFTQRRAMGESLKDPANYMLCSNSKFRLGRTTHARVRVEVAPDSAGGGPARLLQRACSVSAQVKGRVRAAEVRGEVATNQKLYDTTTGVCTAALAASLDVGTPTNTPSTLQYRVGIHHASAAAPSALSSGEASTPSSLESTMYLQGAVGLQGDRTLWTGSRSKQAAQSPADDTPGAAASTTRQPTDRSASPASTSGGAAAGGTGTGPGTKTSAKAIGPHNPLRQTFNRALSKLRGGASEAPASPSRSKAGDKAPARAASGPVSGLGITLPSVGQLPDAAQVRETVVDATQSLKRLREDVQGITTWVAEGSLAQQLAGPAPAKKAGPSIPPRTSQGWSSILPPPHLKAAGLVGLCCKAPLLLKPAAGPAPTEQQQQQQQLQERNSFARASSAMVRNSLSWLHSNVNGAKQGLGLRPFVSGGAELQLGSFQKLALDFTRLLVKADLCLPGPQQLQQPGAPVHRRSHPALALSQRGVCHQLTLSACQQLIGPVRLCADYRFALDSSHPLGSMLDKRPPVDKVKSVGKHIGGMRPSLMECVYALDVAVPQLSGLARVVAWYSPTRREGMLELRLF